MKELAHQQGCGCGAGLDVRWEFDRGVLYMGEEAIPQLPIRRMTGVVERPSNSQTVEERGVQGLCFHVALVQGSVGETRRHVAILVKCAGHVPLD